MARSARGDRPLPPGDPDRSEASADVVVVKVDLALPPSIFFRRLSDAYPNATIEILSRETFPDRTAADVIRFRSPEPVSWWDLLAGMPEVSGLEPLYHNREEALFRVRHRPWPELVRVLQRASLGREYPVVIHGGIGTITVVCRREDLSKLLRYLGTISESVTLRGVRSFPSPEVDALLTPLQRELLRQAVSLGYFEVPRRVSLTGLAEKLGKSKSTISRSLSVIERALVTAAVR